MQKQKNTTKQNAKTQIYNKAELCHVFASFSERVCDLDHSATPKNNINAEVQYLYAQLSFEIV